MNKQKLFNYLKCQESDYLIKLLDDCYNSMKAQQIREVFSHIEAEFINDVINDGDGVLKDVMKFKKDSLNGIYYKCEKVNSKNFMDVPEETDKWFDTMTEYLTESMRLSTQGDHVNAVKCFEVLFDLASKLDSGEEIAFADEAGMWMLPIRLDHCIIAYFSSAASIFDPDKFVKAVLPVIHYDKHSSFMYKAYEKALQAANEEQGMLLKEIVMRQTIATG